MDYECRSDLFRMFNKYKDWGPTIIRIFFGFFFMMHGAGKFWGHIGIGTGPGLEGWLGWMASMGVPGWLASTVAVIELVGGLFLILGIAVRYVSILGSIVLVVAIFMTKLDKGFFSAELDLLYIGAFLSLLISGPGRFSLQNVMAKMDHEKRKKKS